MRRYYRRKGRRGGGVVKKIKKKIEYKVKKYLFDKAHNFLRQQILGSGFERSAFRGGGKFAKSRFRSNGRGGRFAKSKF